MRVKYLAAGALLPLLFAALPANAQSSDFKASNDYAACLVKAKPADARAMIDAKPDSREANTAEAALTGASCEKGGAKNSMLRSAVAIQLYLNSFPSAPAELTGPPPAFVANQDLDLVNNEITRCVALRNPVAADALVRSDLKSDGEKAALSALMPTLEGCVAKGGKIGFGREAMHGLLAEGLLHTRAAAGAN